MDTKEELMWKAAGELFASERHFNQMQNQCRTLASTWLLAAFAGIGFLYKEHVFVDPARAAVFVALSAAAGIFLLWILDVKVWHRLLLANSMAGYRLERENSWMPTVRKYISHTKGFFPVRVHLSFFYCLAIELLVLVAAAFATRATSFSWPRLVSMAFLITGGAIGIGMVWSAFESARRDYAVIAEIDRNASASN